MIAQAHFVHFKESCLGNINSKSPNLERSWRFGGFLRALGDLKIKRKKKD